jgi:2-polyprenyl-3-methyl-5-hydroxy-6-metoxy-1,4-benzoquinol methylase
MNSTNETAALRLRRLLRRSGRLRSAHAFVAWLRKTLRDSPDRVEAEIAAEYRRNDPWQYASTPSERERYDTALEMLDAAGLQTAETAVEIGCGEGFFTELLAPRCGRLLAVDLMTVAIGRATVRCAAHPNVRFRRWDVLADERLGTFDLVVCMDVLQYVSRLAARRRAVAAAADAVAPGGALLLTGVLRSPVVEKAHWGRWLPVGAREDAALFHPHLVLQSQRTTERHLVSLFRRTNAA